MHAAEAKCHRCIDFMIVNEQLRLRIARTRRQEEKIEAFKHKYRQILRRFEIFCTEQRIGEEVKLLRRRVVELESVVKSLLKRLQSMVSKEHK